MSDFSKNLRRIRKKALFSQEQLAERLSVTRQTVSSWERGNSYPDLDMLIKLSEILNTDPNELLYPQNRPTGNNAEILTPLMLRRTALLVLLIGFIEGLKSGYKVYSPAPDTVSVHFVFSGAAPLWAIAILTAIIFFALSKILALLLEIKDKE